MTSLAEKSRFALDWPEVLEALSSHARSLRGQELARSGQFFPSAEACREALRAVEELEALEELGDRMPTGGLVDVREAIETAARGRVLDLQELSDCADAVSNLARLANWVQARAEDAPRLSRSVETLFPPKGLRDDLVESFEAPGVLSERRYPELKRLRQEIVGVQNTIQRTLDELIRDPSIAALLQDKFITRRGDRAVLPPGLPQSDLDSELCTTALRAGRRCSSNRPPSSSSTIENAWLKPNWLVKRPEFAVHSPVSLVRMRRL